MSYTDEKEQAMAATSTMTIRIGADEKSLINDYAKTFGMTA